MHRSPHVKELPRVLRTRWTNVAAVRRMFGFKAPWVLAIVIAGDAILSKSWVSHLNAQSYCKLHSISSQAQTGHVWDEESECLIGRGIMLKKGKMRRVTSWSISYYRNASLKEVREVFCPRRQLCSLPPRWVSNLDLVDPYPIWASSWAEQVVLSYLPPFCIVATMYIFFNFSYIPASIPKLYARTRP